MRVSGSLNIKQTSFQRVSCMQRLLNKTFMKSPFQGPSCLDEPKLFTLTEFNFGPTFSGAKLSVFRDRYSSQPDTKQGKIYCTIASGCSFAQYESRQVIIYLLLGIRLLRVYYYIYLFILNICKIAIYILILMSLIFLFRLCCWESSSNNNQDCNTNRSRRARRLLLVFKRLLLDGTVVVIVN